MLTDYVSDAVLLKALREQGVSLLTDHIDDGIGRVHRANGRLMLEAADRVDQLKVGMELACELGLLEQEANEALAQIHERQRARAEAAPPVECAPWPEGRCTP